MIRIAIAYDCLYPHTIGGVERWYRDLACRLASTHQVTYLTRRQWGAAERADVPPGVELVAVCGGGPLYAKSGRRSIVPTLRFGWAIFWHLLRHRNRYDVVHTCSFPYFHVIGAALVEALGGPALVVDWFEVWSRDSWRSTLGRFGGRVGSAVQRLCIRLTRRALVFSRLAERRLAEEGCGAEITRIEGLCPGLEDSAGDGRREPLVVFAGRLIPEKRAVAIPRAIALARQRIPELRAVVFGDGPERGRLREEVAAAGVDGVVRLRGFAPREELDRAIGQALCVILPSVREGYGLIVVEAASRGTPAIVVAAPDSAASELIEEGENGLIAAGPDPALLAAAIEGIYAAGPALVERTRRWFARNAARLGIDESIRKLEEVYRETVSDDRRRPHPAMDSGSRSPLEAWLARQERRPTPWLAALALLLAAQVSPWLILTPDSVVYLSMARSIARSGDVEAFGGAHTGHPPGYPLLLSGAFHFAERPFVQISILHWCLAALLLVGLYRWARRTAPSAPLLVTGLVLVNVSFWMQLRRPLSELCFLAVAMWAATSLQHVLQARSLRSALARTAPAVATVLALGLIREAGILLVAGFGLSAALGSRDAPRALRLAAFLLVAAAGSAGIIAFVHHDLTTAAAAGGGEGMLGTHLAGLLDPGPALRERLLEGIRLRIYEVGRLVVPGMFKSYAADGRWLDWNTAVYVPLFCLFVTGWWRLARRTHDVLCLTFPFYLSLYVLWPFDAGTRYLFPMLPVLVASLAALLPGDFRHRLTVLALLLVAHLGVTLGYLAIREIPRARACHQQWAEITAIGAVMDADRGRVFALGGPECAAWMLSFAVDRPVRRVTTAAEVGPRARWILAPAELPVPPGFRTRLRPGAYELLERAEEDRS